MQVLSFSELVSSFLRQHGDKLPEEIQEMLSRAIQGAWTSPQLPGYVITEDALQFSYPDKRIGKVFCGVTSDRNLWYSTRIDQGGLFDHWCGVFYCLDALLLEAAFGGDYSGVISWKDHALREAISVLNTEADRSAAVDFIAMLGNLKYLQRLSTEISPELGGTLYKIRSTALDRACEILIEMEGEEREDLQFFFRSVFRTLFHADEDLAWTRLIVPLLNHQRIDQRAMQRIFCEAKKLMCSAPSDVLSVAEFLWTAAKRHNP